MAMSFLQGCASTTSTLGTVASTKSGAVQLFDAEAKPRFNFYLSCASRTVNCEIVERAFDAWGDSRHVTVHSASRNDAAFSKGQASRTQDQNQPYRLSVRYSPDMATFSNSVTNGATGLPVVSYTATVQVFEAATGHLLKTMSFHDEKMVNREQGAANPYLKAQIQAFLGHLDPDYMKG
jgi:hypothetical protein